MSNSDPPQSNGGAPTSLLLDELIVDILSRLPVKTLMQFKCVCKSWKTLISHDPSFAKLHLQRSPRNTHLTLVSDRSSDDESNFSVVPFPVSHLIEAPLTITPFEPYHLLRNVAIPDDPYYVLGNMDCCIIIGSCNGLYCLRCYSLIYEEEEHDWFRFWNPATNTLSEELGCLNEFFRLTFGYDISNDTYKVVAFSADEVKLFSLSDNIWRDIPNFPIVPFDIDASRCHPYVNNGVYVSGTINWLTIQNKTEYEWNDISIDQFLILSLDLTTETYQHLRPPQGFVDVPPVDPAVTVLMDCLCFSHRSKETHFVLWLMMEYGVQDSWTQFLKISFQDLQIDYGISDSLDYGSQLYLYPFYLSESDNTLIMASNQQGYDGYDNHAIIYNWRDKTVEQITSVDNEILWFHTKDYVESLVSIF
ncbi:putative F-box domain-containing protein [Medicago truncatula]|uniref:F-box protein interaction domain protein n=1 Tax=Medicago truncatula TaxID=3880 RepID=A0A072U0K3_MEDTR|nr:F-box/kelch-repeat protein At3g23880 [Medicago truncatula]XP_024627328.1 F-box/kelch-repeat protein At3g23880 [Medicago truncatula]KEH22668.1 F-box protein interaction domain protein [Medicago truncatula]RHN45856.1 putative F-box domain-containing protein [Medicago truncatula]